MLCLLLHRQQQLLVLPRTKIHPWRTRHPSSPSKQLQSHGGINHLLQGLSKSHADAHVLIVLLEAFGSAAERVPVGAATTDARPAWETTVGRDAMMTDIQSGFGTIADAETETETAATIDAHAGTRAVHREIAASPFVAHPSKTAVEIVAALHLALVPGPVEMRADAIVHHHLDAATAVDLGAPMALTGTYPVEARLAGVGVMVVEVDANVTTAVGGAIARAITTAGMEIEVVEADCKTLTATFLVGGPRTMTMIEIEIGIETATATEMVIETAIGGGAMAVEIEAAAVGGVAAEAVAGRCVLPLHLKHVTISCSLEAYGYHTLMLNSERVCTDGRGVA